MCPILKNMTIVSQFTSRKLSQKVQFFYLLALEIIITKGTFELGKEIATGSNFATITQYMLSASIQKDKKTHFQISLLHKMGPTPNHLPTPIA